MILNADCGKVEFGLINLDLMFNSRITQNFVALTLPNFNAKAHMRGKVRPNIIQIELLEISLLWDLDDDEEISYIVEPQQIAIESFVQTGHVHFTEAKYGLRPISPSFNQSLYCVLDSKTEFPVLFTLNSFLDLL
jgi:hypothetical protein